MQKIPLANLELNELADLLKSWEQPAFHAAQVWHWMYQAGAASFTSMTDLPLNLRERLEQRTVIQAIELVEEIRSGSEKTSKLLFRLADGEAVETVDMLEQGEERKRHTVCVSAQVGCPVGCPFCATGQQKFKRNLSAGEIVEQVLFMVRRNPGKPVTNVVFMGMGEPLVNYNATVKAVRIMNATQGLNIGARHMTISTAGVVPGIKRLAKEGLQIGLAVSIHAPTNALRDSLVPMNERFPLEDLMRACKDYFAATGRRVTFEYSLFKGVNDLPRHAAQLAKLLTGTRGHVNLIPASKVRSSALDPSPPQRVKSFREELEKLGVNATVRRSLGGEIEAGCGQLKQRIC